MSETQTPSSAELNAIVTELVKLHAAALHGEAGALAGLPAPLRRLIEWSQDAAPSLAILAALAQSSDGYEWPRGSRRYHSWPGQAAAAGAIDQGAEA